MKITIILGIIILIALYKVLLNKDSTIIVKIISGFVAVVIFLAIINVAQVIRFNYILILVPIIFLFGIFSGLLTSRKRKEETESSEDNWGSKQQHMPYESQDKINNADTQYRISANDNWGSNQQHMPYESQDEINNSDSSNNYHRGEKPPLDMVGNENKRYSHVNTERRSSSSFTKEFHGQVEQNTARKRLCRECGSTLEDMERQCPLCGKKA